ncbi:MAG: phage baseplate assembly protein V [Acidovorax sp.]|nr:phage baseplate assembly protein V [Acidovorax sp.]
MPENTPQQDSPQESTRRLENLARVGTVVEVRHEKPPRCRIKLGDNTTDWLPWIAGRAAGNKGSKWWPPVKGEQCMVLSPGGDLSQGVALLGAYSDNMDAPSDGEGVDRTQWSEKDWAEYRAGRHTIHMDEGITLEVGAACSIAMTPDSITLRVGGAVLQIGPDRITSNVDIVAEGISAVHHVHGGVRIGDDNTKAPQ